MANSENWIKQIATGDVTYDIAAEKVTEKVKLTWKVT